MKAGELKLEVIFSRCEVFFLHILPMALATWLLTWLVVESSHRCAGNEHPDPSSFYRHPSIAP